MINLKENIARIETLVAENTSASLTYAALECRLAIEVVCYDRLRIEHDYISPKDVKSWKPKDLINFLLENLNPHANATYTVSISKEPIRKNEPNLATEEYAEIEYLQIGNQVGFDVKQISKIWNSLGSFLHVGLPKTKSDAVYRYSDVEAIRIKIGDALMELKRLSEGTLLQSGFGEAVSFRCDCGTVNKRRADLLTEGKIVSCYNSNCDEAWTVSIKNGEFGFNRISVSVNCQDCNTTHTWAEKKMTELELNRVAFFTCDQCGITNHVRWQMMHIRKVELG